MNMIKSAATKGRQNAEANAMRAVLAERDRAVAQATVNAIWTWLDQPRQLLNGGEATTRTFCRVGNAVLKVSSQSLSGDLVYNVARNAVTCSRDRVAISIAPATEADLLDVMEIVKGSARLHIQEFLRIVRNEPAQPLEIKIVNAAELQKDTVLTIKRDDTGKMTGAAAMKVP